MSGPERTADYWRKVWAVAREVEAEAVSYTVSRSTDRELVLTRGPWTPGEVGP